MALKFLIILSIHPLGRCTPLLLKDVQLNCWITGMNSIFSHLTGTEGRRREEERLSRSPCRFLSIIPSIAGTTGTVTVTSADPSRVTRLSINMQIGNTCAPSSGGPLNLINPRFPRVLSPSRFCSLPQRCQGWPRVPRVETFTRPVWLDVSKEAFRENPRRGFRPFSKRLANEKIAIGFYILNSLTLFKIV